MSTRPPPATTAPGRPFSTVALVGLAVVLALTLTAGWWVKARCLYDGTVGWEDTEQYLGWCYTDVVPLFGARELDIGSVPYVDFPVEYPVLVGAQMYLTALPARLFDDPADQLLAFFNLTTLTNALAAVAILVVLARLGLPPRRLLWWAGAPTLALYLVHNWDLVALLLLVLAVAAHLRGRDAMSGALVGLGVAAKLFPGVLLPLVVATRVVQGRWRDAGLHVGAAIGAWALVNVPVALVAPDGWARFWTFNAERGANFDSLWYLLGQARGVPVSADAATTLSAVAFLGGAGLITLIGLWRQPTDRWWSLLLPVLIWFLVTNKVYSPQFSVWLLPFAALAAPRAAPYVAFLVADLAVYLVEFPFLAGVTGESGAPDTALFAAVFLVRTITLLWLLVDVLWTRRVDDDALERLRATPPPPTVAAAPAR